MAKIDSIAAVSLVVLWSSGFIGAELGTAHASAHTLLAWRYVIAAVILAGWCWYRGLRPTWQGVRRQVVLGFFCQFAYLGCIVTGVGMGVPAGTAALIAAMQPLVVAAASSPVLGESLGTGRTVSLFVGFAGVVLVVAGDLGGASIAWSVYLLPVVGTLALSTGTVLERKLATTEPIPLAMCIQAVTSAVLFSTWSVLAGDPVPQMTVGFWAAVAWVIVFATFGAYGSYLFVLRRSGATRASALLYLTPAMTMVWAFVMFGDPITWTALVGLAVTLAAACEWKSITHYVFALTWRGAPTPSRPAEPASRSSAATL
nr:DMT family transporter [Rhodococcus sp. (in: high G+C Gram-positive bacteria)]